MNVPIDLVPAIVHPARQYRMAFQVGAHSARHLRRIVRTYLQLWEMEELTCAAELAVTELIANVVRHVPDRRCSVLVLRLPKGLRVEVADSSPTVPTIRAAEPFEERGRGLAIVAAVVDDWGVDVSAGGGKTVWFECAAVSSEGGAGPSGRDASDGSAGGTRCRRDAPM
ncbi:ATP-binding protein [Streptomyces sp. NPDC001922]|uniref:ATP-binding protein n=1 Tax=Streptomyces sp. NPDC001922 TaxID=3364624 RepID=UPI003691242E